jgi:putative endonuclease
MHFLYILHSLKDGNFYTGITSDLDRRIKEHESGKNTSTKYRRPLILIYYEAYLLKEDAGARERYLKTSMGRRVVRKQLANYLESFGKVATTS